jgi:diaminopimelate decarboxylase
MGGATMSFAAVAERFGTPVYVYERPEVTAAHEALRAALPAGTGLYYSLKANPHPDVAAALAERGCRAEVSSVGEIDAAATAGFPAATTLMTGPGKTRDDMAYALAHGVRRFSVDSPEDLRRLGSTATAQGVEVDCLLRLNPDTPLPGMGLSMTGTASQFGADVSWMRREPHRFTDVRSAKVSGLHCYMGTNIADADLLTAQFTSTIGLAAELVDTLGLDVAELDIGGGFGAPYAREGARPSLDGIRTAVEDALDAGFPGWGQAAPLVTFESGRYLTGTSGTLLSRVVDVKNSKGRTFVVLDAGINQLGGMAGLRRVPRIAPTLVPVTPRHGRIEDCVVTGPLCTPLDTWSDGVDLPETEPGDLVAVPNVGAYGLTASLVAFLGHPAATEVVLDGDRIVSATRMRTERVPVRPAGDAT